MDKRVVEEKIVMRHLPHADGGMGWMVAHVPAGGRRAGLEHCLAMLCGGNMGKVLAAMVAKQIATMKMVDIIEIEPDAGPRENLTMMTPQEFRAIRERMGLTQAELAFQLGYRAASRVSEIENGTFAITPMLARLMRAYEDGYRSADWPHADTVSRMAPQR